MKPLELVSYGAGVNSTAMLIGMVSKDIRPDLILFSDTGGEFPEVYQYLVMFSNWLVKRDFPAIRTVRYRGKHKTLEMECETLQTLPSLAFGWKTCSQKWKARAVRQYMRREGIETWRTAIGFDAGESRRAQGYPDVWYPLRDWVWNRERCKQAISGAGLCQPRKSACFFCPATTKREVRQLALSEPDLFARAVKMEQRARQAGKLQTTKGLGRRWSWQALMAADAGDLEQLPEPPQTPCECWT